jgi:hypothetical protein
MTEQFEKSMKVTLCKTCKTCPSVSIHKELDTVVLGGSEEGFTTWKKGHFKDLVDEIKAGKFDDYI